MEEEYLQALDKIYERHIRAAAVKIPPPEVQIIGPKKVRWSNFPDVCLGIGRDPAHVKEFFLSELSTTGTLNLGGEFLMEGRYKVQQLEKLLVNYIKKYVVCPSCRGLETELVRDTVMKMLMILCRTCNTARAVDQIRTGFHATTRADRKKGNR